MKYQSNNGPMKKASSTIPATEYPGKIDTTMIILAQEHEPQHLLGSCSVVHSALFKSDVRSKTVNSHVSVMTYLRSCRIERNK